MLIRFERLARGMTLLGAVVWVGVFLPALIVSLPEQERPKSGFLRALYSERVIVPGFIAFFAMLKLLWKPLPARVPSLWRGVLFAAGLASFLSGLALAVWGRFALGRMFGVSSGLDAPLHKDHVLVTSGPYALVRHPIYLGDALLAFGLLAIWRNWASLFLSAMAPGLIIRARREEESLAGVFGDRWRDYAARVPMLVPELSRAATLFSQHRRNRL